MMQLKHREGHTAAKVWNRSSQVIWETIRNQQREGSEAAQIHPSTVRTDEGLIRGVYGCRCGLFLYYIIFQTVAPQSLYLFKVRFIEI